MSWPTPQRPEAWTKSIWAKMPAEMVVRLVRFRVAIPGFRTQHVVLVTTPLDKKAYSDEALAGRLS